jgi:raffinose/stachyose/melibiose transport system substrate-binding protein
MRRDATRSEGLAGRRLGATSVAVMAAIAVAGCSATPGASRPKAVTENGPAGCTSHGVIRDDPKCVAKLGHITLKVTDVENATTAEQNAINKAFMAEYPNITVQRTGVSGGRWDSPGGRVTFALSSASSPDVAEIDPSDVLFAKLIKGGLVQPLDPYDTAFGWGRALVPAATSVTRAQPNGTAFGTGQLYGLASNTSLIGWYYNKRLLQRLGGSLPTTMPQLQALLNRAKAAGVVPIQGGDSDQSTSFHLGNDALAATLPASVWSRITAFNVPNANVLNSGGDQAGQLLQTWGRYLPPGYRGLGVNDAIARFENGQGLFLPQGDWMASTFQKKFGPDVGFFVVPHEAGGPRATLFGPGSTWIVPTRSKHPAVAAVYLNFLTSLTAARIYVANDTIPARPLTASEIPPNAAPVFRDLLNTAAYLARNKSGAPFQLPTDATAEHDPTPATQAALAGRLAPTGWLKAQKEFLSAAIASRH